MLTLESWPEDTRAPLAHGGVLGARTLFFSVETSPKGPRIRGGVAEWTPTHFPDTFLELIHACGLDLPLTLMDLPPAVDDEPLSELQRRSPERRLDRMLDDLSTKRQR